MAVYYPFADTWGVVVPSVVRSNVAILAEGVTSSVAPALWQAFWGVMMVLVAVLFGLIGFLITAMQNSTLRR